MSPRATASAQRGLGAFGTLVVLALAALAGYYLYTGFSGNDATPTCQGQFQSCMEVCNRTQTDNAGMQACRSKCNDDQTLCNMPSK